MKKIKNKIGCFMITLIFLALFGVEGYLYGFKIVGLVITFTALLIGGIYLI